MENITNTFLNIKDVKEDVEGPTPRIIHSKQKALTDSINESAAASFSAGISTNYIVPFALALKANALHIGILSSLYGFIFPLSQLFGSRLMATRPRKKIVLKFVFLQALTWIPIAGLAMLFWKGLFQQYLPIALIVLYTIMAFFGGSAYPAWFSWIGDLIPAKDRGKYLGVRNKATGLVSLAAVLIGAFLLDAFKTKGFVLIGFAILFAAAFTFRLLSYNLFRHQYVPQFKVRKESYFSFWSFLKRFDNYGKFAVWRGVLNFAFMIASPFFAVYMLQELNFNYVTFTIVSMSSAAFYLLFTPLVGKFSDRYGNIKLFYISNFIFAITPLLWIFIKTPVGLIFIPQLLSGLANATLLLSITSFTYDAVDPQKRGICVAYTGILIGIGIFLGSLLGGLIVHNADTFSTNPFFLVFSIAAATRFLAGIIFLPKIKEEKSNIKKLPPLHIDVTHPFRTIHTEIGWFKSILK